MGTFQGGHMNNKSIAEFRGAAGSEVLREDSTGASDGDGRMIGWILVYASVVVVLAAVAIWARVS